MIRFRLLITTTLVLGTFMLAACGDDDDERPAAATAAPTQPPATGTGSGATAPAASATSAAASSSPATTPTASVARNPAYYTYEVSAGDTLLSVTNVVNGEPGTAKAGLPDQIRDLNKLTSNDLAAGQQLLVPLVASGPQSILPEASLRSAIGAGAAGGSIQLLIPGLALRDGYMGRLALTAMKVSDGMPASEGFGYLLRFSEADRPVIKGGVRDADAVMVDEAFTVAGGSLVPELERRASAAGASTAKVTRAGVDYLVAASPKSRVTAQQAATMLEAAPAP